jgi:hypothetical protein
MEFKLGQRITFKSPTRDGCIKATRVINGSFRGLPTCRFNGWNAFVVREHEIININQLNN